MSTGARQGPRHGRLRCTRNRGSGRRWNRIWGCELSWPAPFPASSRIRYQVLRPWKIPCPAQPAPADREQHSLMAIFGFATVSCLIIEAFLLLFAAEHIRFWKAGNRTLCKRVPLSDRIHAPTRQQRPVCWIEPHSTGTRLPEDDELRVIHVTTDNVGKQDFGVG